MKYVYSEYINNSYNSAIKYKTFSKKMGQRFEQTIQQRGRVNGQRAHEKVPNVSSHQGNASPNHYSLTHTRLGENRKTGNNVLAMQCWWECKMVPPPWKTVLQVLKVKHRITLPCSHSTRRHLEKLQQVSIQ